MNSNLPNCIVECWEILPCGKKCLRQGNNSNRTELWQKNEICHFFSLDRAKLTWIVVPNPTTPNIDGATFIERCVSFLHTYFRSFKFKLHVIYFTEIVYNFFSNSPVRLSVAQLSNNFGTCWKSNFHHLFPTAIWDWCLSNSIGGFHEHVTVIQKTAPTEMKFSILGFGFLFCHCQTKHTHNSIIFVTIVWKNNLNLDTLLHPTNPSGVNTVLCAAQFRSIQCFGSSCRAFSENLNFQSRANKAGKRLAIVGHLFRQVFRSSLVDV